MTFLRRPRHLGVVSAALVGTPESVASLHCATVNNPFDTVGGAPRRKFPLFLVRFALAYAAFLTSQKPDAPFFPVSSENFGKVCPYVGLLLALLLFLLVILWFIIKRAPHRAL